MYRIVFAMVLLLLFSCNQQSKIIQCDLQNSTRNKFTGSAVIFFHKPVSGSTYQFFLFPVCDIKGEEELEIFLKQHQLADGISFNITSDDERFKTVYTTSRKIELKSRDQLAENFRSIYYSFRHVEIGDIESIVKVNIQKSEKKLVFRSGNEVIIKYCFRSFVNFALIN